MPNLFGSNDNHLIISDIQIPYQAANALQFCKYLKKFYRIPDENVLCVGDEVDNYFGSLYKKSPNAKHTPNSEIAESISILKEWYSTFPKMKLAVSNHGMRWAKKALDAEIPSQLIRDYKEVLGAPKEWVWKDSWVFRDLKHPFRMVHGMGYSGQMGAKNAALDAGISTVIGHLHSFGGVNHIKTSHQQLWAMNVGCLIDPEAYAFEYASDTRYKATLGCGVVLDSGKIPIFIPYE